MAQIIGRRRKDPESVENFTVDWSDWLAVTDTIASVVWTVGTGLTEEATSNTTTTATIQLSGGTAGETYTVECKITTTNGETDERTFKILCEER